MESKIKELILKYENLKKHDEALSKSFAKSKFYELSKSSRTQAECYSRIINDLKEII